MNTPENTTTTDSQVLTAADIGIFPVEILATEVVDAAESAPATGVTTTAAVLEETLTLEPAAEDLVEQPVVEETTIAVDPMLADAAEATSATDASASDPAVITDVTYSDLTAEGLAAAEAEIASLAQAAAEGTDAQAQGVPATPSEIVIAYNGAKYAVAAVLAARLLGGAKLIDSTSEQPAVLNLSTARIVFFLNVNPNEKWGKVAASMMNGGNTDQKQCAILLADVASDNSDVGAVHVLDQQVSLFANEQGATTVLIGASIREANPALTAAQVLIRAVTNQFHDAPNLVGFPYEQVFGAANPTVVSNIKVLLGEALFLLTNRGMALEPSQSLLAQLEALGGNVELINSAIGRPYAFEGAADTTEAATDGVFVAG